VGVSAAGAEDGFLCHIILIQTGTYPEHGRLRPSLAGQLTLSNAGVGGAG
jgi:hypothetical protein